MLYEATSLSPHKRIPGRPPLTKKRELFPGLPPASPGSFLLPDCTPCEMESPRPGSGILTRFPFDGLRPIAISDDAAPLTCRSICLST